MAVRPADLWEQTTRVLDEFEDFGQPTRDGFGLTCAVAGEQLWAGSPRRIIEPAPWAPLEDWPTYVPARHGRG
ncbi:hypothetical protein [Streptomyces thermolilacinus]|uniref:Uncharacterized protein n=1 Tax=Streptomyces thermolilacinus SPC6 TaxID=1306406 RepID=A0A1D3DLE7_9ACTN|nr:hypothetical protein [Streptomyces thermolilacinus]OEJ93145.1 hypothetical protein J116_000195 [Streptomyces thermolilacinus SPC6]